MVIIKSTVLYDGIKKKKRKTSKWLQFTGRRSSSCTGISAVNAPAAFMQWKAMKEIVVHQKKMHKWCVERGGMEVVKKGKKRNVLEKETK